MTRVVISQPMYFPWAGFLAQMNLADIFVWLDDAQFSKGSFTNRIQIKLQSGIKWMTVPLTGKGTKQPINKLQSNGEKWRLTHKSMLTQSLIGQPNFKQAVDIFDAALSCQCLCETLIASAELQAQFLEILPQKIYRASELKIDGNSSQRVLNILKQLNCSDYVTGHGAANYLDHDAFNTAGISVSYMNYDILPWEQSFGKFSPYVTGLDLIASGGKAAQKNINLYTEPASTFLANIQR
ncbi:WbqC family protein [Lentilitoribacter sp. EG35]|uniref:WbqC family protein n=1 Tax=Lentilitoribacter sp. EG35 TaxID=3234192 RepID=UPI0034612503